MAKDEIRSEEWIGKIEDLVSRAESLSDPVARGIAVDLLEAVLDFHAAGLERVMEIVASAPDGEDLTAKIATDDLTSSILLLHNLHPDDLDTRIKRAVRKLDAMFSSLGAKLYLSALVSDSVRLQFDSSRAWSGAPVRESVENTIFQAAPEITTVVIEGLKEAPLSNFVPVSDLLAARS
jgi:hypothetical protein